MTQRRSFWAPTLAVSALLLAACQPAVGFVGSTPVSLPTQTASPTYTPSPTATEILPSATPTATLAPFPAEALTGNGKNTSERSVRVDASQVPAASSPFEHFYFSHPVPENHLGERIPSSRYGNDQHAENGAGHTGLDFGLNHGTPILAAAEGEVIFSGYGLLTWPENAEDPYGLSIVIQHDFGFDGRPLYTAYAHLSQVLVEEGERVERGDEIGRSGDTGFSSGPHIHFEVRIDLNSHSSSRNPELWIIPKPGEGVLVGTILTTYGWPVKGQSVKLTHLETGRIRWAYSYLMDHNITADDYFGENFVQSSLPAGSYEVAVYYVTGVQRAEIDIEAGKISYFQFNGTKGFDFAWPPIEDPPNLPN